jgi:hypothetical protein
MIEWANGGSMKFLLLMIIFQSFTVGAWARNNAYLNRRLQPKQSEREPAQQQRPEAAKEWRGTRKNGTDRSPRP